MLFSYHLLYFCTALSLIIMLSSHYHHHKSKTFSQLTQCPFTGTLLLFLIIVHSRMKIYEVLKRASVHLPVVIHYSTGTTTNSASLVLKRVRMRSLESSVEHGDRFVSGCVHLVFDWKYFLVEENDAEKTCHKVFSGKLL